MKTINQEIGQGSRDWQLQRFWKDAMSTLEDIEKGSSSHCLLNNRDFSVTHARLGVTIQGVANVPCRWCGHAPQGSLVLLK